MIQFVFVGLKDGKQFDYLSQISSRLSDELINVNLDEEYINDLTLKLEATDDSGSECQVIFEIATYNSEKQLSVQINIVDPENFNELAYSLKEKIKNCIRRDWSECIWLEDSQSALFAEQLYTQIYKAENDLREFINRVMIKEMGVKWWETYVSEHLLNTFKERQADYKVTAPLYKNVDNMLLSLNSDHLTQIMEYKIRKWNPQHNEKVEKLVLSDNESDLKSVKGILLNQFETVTDLWRDVFSNYFDSDFLEEWAKFCKNRNHVAHNKLIDKTANISIKKNIQKVQREIDQALKEFHSITLSDEDKRNLFNISTVAENDIIEEEAGINIYKTHEIEEIILEEVTNVVNLIEDDLHFRSDLEIDKSVLSEEDEQILMTINSKVMKDNTIIMRLNKWINDDAGATSTGTIELYINGDLQRSYDLEYQNGEAYFNEEQANYMPRIYNHLEPIDHEELLDNLNDIIDSLFPNKVQELYLHNYNSVKDGGPQVVANFECEECGEDTVSINEEFHEFGVCVNCGYNQASAIESCMRCEEYYNENVEGQDGFCDSCYEYFKQQ